MRNKKRLFFIVLSVLVLIALAIPKISALAQKDAAGDKPGDAKASSPVEAIIVQTQKLNKHITTTGNIIANESVSLQSEISGKIDTILFKEGKPVKKGDLLVEINDDEQQAQLKKLQFQQKLAKEKEYRLRKQLQIQSVSQQAYDEALNSLNMIEADIQLVQAQIAKTEIRAPFDGIVGLKNVSEGAYITPNTPVATIVSMNPIKIDFSVPEKYASQIGAGDAFTFTIQKQDKQYSGKIYAIEPRIDPDTRTLKLRGLSPNEKGLIYPGSFAEIELSLNQVDDAIMIPSQALIPDMATQRVYVVKNGKAFLQNVETGTRRAQTIQITRGLQPSDTLITSGIQQLRPGSPVSITKLD